MKITCIKLLLLMSFFWCNSANAQKRNLTPRERYILTTKPNPIKGDEESPIVSLEDKQTGQILWKREVFTPDIVWSQNHRAIAVGGGGNLFVWRVGEKLRNFGVPGRNDYLMGFRWSPDNRRLLIRTGSSGMSDFDYGAVYCLKLGSGKTYRYNLLNDYAREMKWRDNKTAVYRVMDYDTHQPEKKQRVWRAP